MFKEKDLLEKKGLREKVISRVEVLDKVKDLLLLPNTEFATTEQVAKYYEVEEVALRQIAARNNDELTSDGLVTLRGKEIKDFYDTRDKLSQVSVVPERGGILINGVKVAYSSNILFPKRAILRVGMLLRDSAIAKEVRTRLLDLIQDTQEQSPELVQSIANEIDEEKQLMLERVEAEIKGDYDTVWVVNAKLFGLKNKRIKKLEDTVEQITTNALTITESRAVINRIVRTIAFKSFKGIFGHAWDELYSLANYKLGINIKKRNKRKDQSYLDVLTEEELFELEKIARSWAVDSGIDLDEIIKIA